MNTIVVPTDLSPATDAALSVAADIARVYNSTIILLHSVVYPVPMPTYAEAVSLTVNYTVDEFRDVEQEADQTLRQLAGNEKYKDVMIIPKLLTNGQGMVDNVTHQPADLIVMTSKGASGLEEWLVGSNAETIVRYAHCPVLVVKQPIAHFQPQNIVYAIDIDEQLKTVQHFPFQLGAADQHQFLYVTTPTDNRDSEGIQEWVNELAKAKGITEFTLTIRRAKSVPEGIIEYANEIQADLIVLSTHGHTGLRHILSGSVAEDVLNHAEIPVLIMRV
ncbi:universal stress protein [Spirosoma sp. SC4-14]|uniref:universal stress protein n=1 Tax=Spirosoma sp. SC4-14 TaxID=3128900 RepID=UPI0030D60871